MKCDKQQSRLMRTQKPKPKRVLSDDPRFIIAISYWQMPKPEALLALISKPLAAQYSTFLKPVSLSI